jgi:PCI domain
MPQATEVRKMLTDKIKEESLRTYLFTYATVYDAISMATLADMFELPVKQVYGIISKMIINEELMVCSVRFTNDGRTHFLPFRHRSKNRIKQ